MIAATSDGAERLRSEILDQAGREREEILSRARSTADQLIAQAEQEARHAADVQLQAARAEAKRRQEALLSTLSVEIDRLDLAQTEDLLNGIRERALDILRHGSGFDRRDSLIGLAVQALARMNGSGFILRVCAADLRAFGDGLAEDIRRRSGRPLLKLDAGRTRRPENGDWILQDEEGRQMWDLTLEARLKRMWPELRRQIVAQAGLAWPTRS